MQVRKFFEKSVIFREKVLDIVYIWVYTYTRKQREVNDNDTGKDFETRLQGRVG